MYVPCLLLQRVALGGVDTLFSCPMGDRQWGTLQTAHTTYGRVGTLDALGLYIARVIKFETIV